MKQSLTWINRTTDLIGAFLVKAFHTIALFAIGAAVFWAGFQSYLGMINSGKFSIDDILLLFIYLELGAMVGIYFKTARLPVRFLIYVAITALTRLLIDIISLSHGKADWGIIMVSGAILILTLASLVIRYGSFHLPIDTGLEELADRPALKPGKTNRTADDDK
jgi:phosphate starvation-inducible membrane PsiE